MGCQQCLSTATMLWQKVVSFGNQVGLHDIFMRLTSGRKPSLGQQFDGHSPHSTERAVQQKIDMSKSVSTCMYSAPHYCFLIIRSAFPFHEVLELNIVGMSVAVHDSNLNKDWQSQFESRPSWCRWSQK